ncbi:hypothetical protein [Cupriavidus necator]|uniref:hypothetical protein n=1 Tax=Cupriavidus necator TaxID=106590 RepID=UPI000A9728CB
MEADDGAFGRRVRVHEYRQRDGEDLGRAAREFTTGAATCHRHGFMCMPTN